MNDSIRAIDIRRIKKHNNPNAHVKLWFDVITDAGVIFCGCSLVVTDDATFISLPFSVSKKGRRFSHIRFVGGRKVYEDFSAQVMALLKEKESSGEIDKLPF